MRKGIKKKVIDKKVVKSFDSRVNLGRLISDLHNVVQNAKKLEETFPIKIDLIEHNIPSRKKNEIEMPLLPHANFAEIIRLMHAEEHYKILSKLYKGVGKFHPSKLKEFEALEKKYFNQSQKSLFPLKKTKNYHAKDMLEFYRLELEEANTKGTELFNANQTLKEIKKIMPNPRKFLRLIKELNRITELNSHIFMVEAKEGKLHIIIPLMQKIENRKAIEEFYQTHKGTQ
ncbi:MAG: hypothetical protein JW703_04625 [Candidatus Diapherotrites archaeon]|nr:hypothetical protein [Candidatus Diapherotrites archaeon]